VEYPIALGMSWRRGQATSQPRTWPLSMELMRASFGADVGLRSRFQSQNRTARSFTPVRQSVAIEFRSGDANAFVT
jgi:hypothetical protein